MKATILTALSVAALTLSACGTTPTERTLSGGAIGAGVGAGAASIMGGSPWTGAAIGGAAGAITGATTRSR
jgi:osmotically inducible lipoprotein OsmB